MYAILYLHVGSTQKAEKGRRDQKSLQEGITFMTIRQRLTLSSIMKSVESRIGERCIHKMIDGQNWFIVDENHLVHLKCLLDENINCLVVRHAKSAAETHSAEDGGHFYPEDYHSVDEMIRAMLDEVWSAIPA